MRLNRKVKILIALNAIKFIAGAAWAAISIVGIVVLSSEGDYWLAVSFTGFVLAGILIVISACRNVLNVN